MRWPVLESGCRRRLMWKPERLLLIRRSAQHTKSRKKARRLRGGDTTVEITGETHVHVDLDGREVGDTTTPIVDENMARIDTHKKRGG